MLSERLLRVAYGIIWGVFTAVAPPSRISGTCRILRTDRAPNLLSMMRAVGLDIRTGVAFLDFINPSLMIYFVVPRVR